MATSRWGPVRARSTPRTSAGPGRWRRSRPPAGPRPVSTCPARPTRSSRTAGRCWWCWSWVPAGRPSLSDTWDWAGRWAGSCWTAWCPASSLSTSCWWTRSPAWVWTRTQSCATGWASRSARCAAAQSPSYCLAATWWEDGPGGGGAAGGGQGGPGKPRPALHPPALPWAAAGPPPAGAGRPAPVRQE